MDTTTFTEVFEHLKHPEKAIEEIHRVTGEKLFLATPNNCFLKRVKRFLLMPKLSRIAPGHFKEYSWSGIKKLFEGHGFKLTRFSGFKYFIDRPKFLYNYLDLGKKFPKLSAKVIMEFQKLPYQKAWKG